MLWELNWGICRFWWILRSGMVWCGFVLGVKIKFLEVFLGRKTCWNCWRIIFVRIRRCKLCWIRKWIKWKWKWRLIWWWMLMMKMKKLWGCCWKLLSSLSRTCSLRMDSGRCVRVRWVKMIFCVCLLYLILRVFILCSYVVVIEFKVIFVYFLLCKYL